MATSLIIVEGPGAVLKSLILGETSIDDVMNAGTLQIKGSRRQTKRFFGCFRNPQNDPLPVAEVASEAAPVVDSVS
jgi:hypothetical protein